MILPVRLTIFLSDIFQIYPGFGFWLQLRGLSKSVEFSEIDKISNQDIKASNEYKLFSNEFKDITWESTIDRFHIQDVKTKTELLNFILKI